MQIYDWAKRPQKDFQFVASAGILVLMIFLLIMNSIAIFIRNKFQKGINITRGSIMVQSLESGSNTQAEKTNIVYNTQQLNLWYGNNHALKDINLQIKENEVTAIIGPSGCGKSTYIKTLNRMVELVPTVKTSGKILYRERNIFDK